MIDIPDSIKERIDTEYKKSIATIPEINFMDVSWFMIQCTVMDRETNLKEIIICLVKMVHESRLKQLPEID